MGEDYISPDVIDDDYEITYRKVDATSSYEDIFAMGVNNDILWPGALVDISTDAYKKIDVSRSNLTISGSFESAIGRTEGAELAQTVESPSLASVRTAIGKIVNDNIRPGVNLANAGFSCSIRNVRSEQEFSMNLGIGLKYAGFGLEDNFSYKNINKQTNLVMVLKQVFYTIDADGPGTFNTIDMMQLGKNGQIPAYVSSVSYGRIAIISIQTNYSADEVSNALKISYGTGVFNVEGNLTLADLASDSGTAISCFVYGGSISDAGNMVSVATGDIGSMLESWGDAISTEDAIGMPVSYKIRHLDGEMAKLQDAASYVIKEVTYRPKKLISWDSFDQMILNGSYLKSERVIIDLSSVLLNSSNFSQQGEVHAERIIKIPANVDEFTLIGSNNQADMTVLSLSLIVSEREKKPLTIGLRGITFTAQDGESAIRVEGRDNVTIVLSQRNTLTASGTYPAIDCSNGKITIQGGGTLTIYGGDGGIGEIGGTGIRAKELILQSQNDINIYAGKGGDGSLSQNAGDGGIAVYAEKLTISMADGILSCYGGNGGTGVDGVGTDGWYGGNGGVGIFSEQILFNSECECKIYGGAGGKGGRGADGAKGTNGVCGWESKGRDGQAGQKGFNGGSGGNGAYAISCLKIIIDQAKSIYLQGGAGGDGGNGGNGGTGGDGGSANRQGWNDNVIVDTGGIKGLNGGNGSNGGNGGNSGKPSIAISNEVEVQNNANVILKLDNGSVAQAGLGGEKGNPGNAGTCHYWRDIVIAFWKESKTGKVGNDIGKPGEPGEVLLAE